MEYFHQYPFAALGLLTAQGFGNQTGFALVVQALHTGKWGMTFAELVMLGIQNQQLYAKYSDVVSEYNAGVHPDTESLIKRTLDLWLKFRQEHQKMFQPSIEPLLALLGMRSESELLAGLQELESSGLVVLSPDEVITPTEAFFDQLLAKRRPSGMMNL